MLKKPNTHKQLIFFKEQKVKYLKHLVCPVGAEFL